MAPRLRLRQEPYDPDARDADNDGIVQEGTAWERPAGTRLISAAGELIPRGRTSGSRPSGLRVVDRDGKTVRYTPTYDRPSVPGADFTPMQPGSSALSEHGAGTLADFGLSTVRDLATSSGPVGSASLTESGLPTVRTLAAPPSDAVPDAPAVPGAADLPEVGTGLRVTVPDMPRFHGVRAQENGFANPAYSEFRDELNKLGVNVRGTPMSWEDDRIPDVVFHATPALRAIEADGVLRAGGVGGLGGDEKDRVVSMTTSREIADGIAQDMRLLSRAAKTKDDQELLRVLRDDAAADGVPIKDVVWDSLARSAASDPVQAFNEYLWSRDLAGGRRNPLFVDLQRSGTWDKFATVDEADIGVVEIPKKNLDNGALLTDFDLGQGYLDEVRSYGDIKLDDKQSFGSVGERVRRAFKRPTDDELAKMQERVDELRPLVEDDEAAADEWADLRKALRAAGDYRFLPPGTAPRNGDQSEEALRNIVPSLDLPSSTKRTASLERGERYDGPLGDEFPVTIAPESVVWRGVSIEDYHRMLDEGYITTDGRKNIGEDSEGTNFAVRPSTALYYLPNNGEGVVLAVDASKLKDPFAINSDDYIRTREPLPMSVVIGVSEPFGKLSDPENGVNVSYWPTTTVRPLSSARQNKFLEQVKRTGEPPRTPFKPSPPPLSGAAEQLGMDAESYPDLLNRLNESGYTMIDYETTGFGDGNVPVQVGLVKIRDGKVLERENLFMNPDRPLSEWSKKNLKNADGEPLTDEWLSTQMSVAEAHRRVDDFIGDDILAAHNLPFDDEVLRRSFKESGIEYRSSGGVDTLELLRQAVPRDSNEGLGGHGLKPLTEFFGVKLGDQAHTADADAEATVEVLNRALRVANGDAELLKPGPQKERFDKATAKFERELVDHAEAMEFYRRIRAAEAPSEPDPSPVKQTVVAALAKIDDSDPEREIDLVRQYGSNPLVRPDDGESRDAYAERVAQALGGADNPVARDLVEHNVRLFDAAQARRESVERRDRDYQAGKIIPDDEQQWMSGRRGLAMAIDDLFERDIDQVIAELSDRPRSADTVRLLQEFAADDDRLWSAAAAASSAGDLASAQRILADRDWRRAQLEENLRDRVTTRADELLNDPEVRQFVQVDSSILPTILKDGRLRSGYDADAIGSTTTAEYYGARTGIESRFFGVSPESDNRPLYGYLWRGPDGAVLRDGVDTEEYGGVSVDHPKASMVAYGDAAIRLKPEVRERSTLTFGDSLASGDLVSPARFDDVRPEAAGIWSMWLLGAENINDRGSYADSAGPAYIESQIHGGIRLDDIEAVVLPAFMQDEPDWQDTVEALTAAGIAIEWV